MAGPGSRSIKRLRARSEYAVFSINVGIANLLTKYRVIVIILVTLYFMSLRLSQYEYTQFHSI